MTKRASKPTGKTYGRVTGYASSKSAAVKRARRAAGQGVTRKKASGPLAKSPGSRGAKGAVAPAEGVDFTWHLRPGLTLTGADRNFIRALAVDIAERRAKGVPVVTDSEAPQDLAERALSTLPQHSRLAEDTGPFYNTASLKKWLDVSRQRLDTRVREGTLLMCLTSDRQRVYPVWQFDIKGGVLPGIAEVIEVFRGVGLEPGWAVAKWLNVPNPDLGDSKASALLAAGEVEAVVNAARHHAERMSH